MDIPKINTIDREAAEYTRKTERLEQTTNATKVNEYDESEAKQQDKQVEQQQEELVLNTIKFGYNRSTNDFIIRVIKPNGEIGQYPTEDMLTLKDALKRLTDID